MRSTSWLYCSNSKSTGVKGGTTGLGARTVISPDCAPAENLPLPPIVKYCRIKDPSLKPSDSFPSCWSPDEAGLTETQNVGADPHALNGTWGGLESGRAKKLHHQAAGLLGIPGRKARIIAQQVGVDRHQRNAIVFETYGQPKLRLFRSRSTKP